VRFTFISKAKHYLAGSLVGLIAILLTVGFHGAPAGAATACTNSLQTKINAAPWGGTVKADSCVYREQILIDKPITLSGQPGSQIRGSDVWRSWTKSFRH
jgi:nitrous oxidase accessory protein NosD